VPAAEYRLRVTPPAQRGLDRLPAAVAAAIAEFVLGDLRRDPRRVGRPLRAELTGTWSARRGPYRIVYSIDDGNKTVAVLRIDHRADVYRHR
jgi:mRNA interferase RelE/StbE